MKINPHLFCISFDFHYLCIIKVHAHKGYHPYIGESGDLAYNSYSSQFDYLWKCMGTGYVFWDVDETDWDAVYVEYMPKFQALDKKHEAGQDVTLAELETLYKGVIGGLKDHHFYFMVKNGA